MKTGSDNPTPGSNSRAAEKDHVRRMESTEWLDVKPFLGGAFYVAIKAGVPVVPMAIVGSFEAAPMNCYVIKPRPLALVVGEPISTKEFTPRAMDQLAAITQKAVEDLYYSRYEVGDPRPPTAITPAQS